MDSLKINYYLQKVVAVVVLEVIPFIYYQETHNLSYAIVMAVLAACSWFLFPKYVPDDGCRVRKKYLVDMHDEETGITMVANSQTYITFERIVQIYKDTLKCVLDKNPTLQPPTKGPTIKFVSFTENKIPSSSWAIYMMFNETVYINTDLDELRSFRDCLTDTQSVEHECIHHILHKNNVVFELDYTHIHPAFGCGPGVDNRH